jgi:hypothetical protein
MALSPDVQQTRRHATSNTVSALTSALLGLWTTTTSKRATTDVAISAASASPTIVIKLRRAPPFLIAAGCVGGVVLALAAPITPSSTAVKVNAAAPQRRRLWSMASCKGISQSQQLPRSFGPGGGANHVRTAFVGHRRARSLCQSQTEAAYDGCATSIRSQLPLPPLSSNLAYRKTSPKCWSANRSASESIRRPRRPSS